MYLLQPKDKIQIVAPARSVTLDELQYAIRLFETQGWQVVLGKYLFGKHHQFSGTDTERILDMQSAIDNP
ncbi:MAG: LD-carboxypeptidase, partial [Bacteroidales bacterium]|nr:LD-carboxypeptidase [Bacteroidales bacterium]